MINKFIRLLSYARELALMLFFAPCGAVCAKFKREYRDLWLIGERGDDARDNGYRFYKYMKENHPKINTRYIISPTDSDYSKIAELGGAVDYKSFKHRLMYFAAKYLIGTHVQPCAPDKIMYYHLASKGIRPRGKQVFLQHGITLSDMSWLDGSRLYIDLFACGAKPEYEHISSTYNHRDGVVRYLGICRFDNLFTSARRDKMILLMPTWRGSKYPSGKAFLQTAYYKAFNSLLNNENLDELLCAHDCKLIFYPHIEMQPYLNDFTTKSDRITIAGKSDCDVQELLMNCSMLITDYSSVFFDVAYMNKPVLYYQFDREEFYSYHYPKGYFDFERDGFGAHSETIPSNSRETLRVGFFAFDGYHMLDDEGNKSGYGYDFIRKISRYLNVDFEYIGYYRLREQLGRYGRYAPKRRN